MSLRRLRYFLVVAAELNFRRAAKRLHIAQPGLSQQIKALEAELGVTLFVRGPTGVSLTPAGQMLVREGTRLLRDVDQVVRSVQAAERGVEGRLRLVHTRSVAQGRPHELIKAFKADHPNAEVAVESAWTSKNIEMVRAGEVDAGFVRLPIADSAGLDVLVLGETELVVAAPAGHALAHKRFLKFSDLQSERVVSWPRQQAQGYFDFVQSQVWGPMEPNLVAVEPDPEHVLSAVADGVGLCVIDEERARRLRPQGLVIRRFRPGLYAQFGLAWSPSRHSDLLDAFVRHCRENRGDAEPLQTRP